MVNKMWMELAYCPNYYGWYPDGISPDGIYPDGIYPDYFVRTYKNKIK
jgi:hypothetical protein